MLCSANARNCGPRHYFDSAAQRRCMVRCVDTSAMGSSRCVCRSSGFDVLSHAAESLTARPYTKRPKESHSSLRPMSQGLSLTEVVYSLCDHQLTGSNPFSDIGCQEALRLTGRFLARATLDASDVDARHAMMFASTLAGLAFGNVGCHMPHALSYRSNQPLLPTSYCLLNCTYGCCRMQCFWHGENLSAGWLSHTTCRFRPWRYRSPRYGCNSQQSGGVSVYRYNGPLLLLQLSVLIS